MPHPTDRKTRPLAVVTANVPLRDRTAQLLLGAIIAVALLSALQLAVRFPVDPDELEHLHATWLWAQGLQPYTQFFEHHPPLYWLLLRPVLHSAPDRDLIQLLLHARIFSWAVAAGTVAAAWWLFAALFGRPAAAYGAAFLAMAFGVQEHAVAVRPDGLSLLLAVAGSALMIDGLGQAVNRPTISLWKVGLGGLLIGTGICVLTKVLFWAAAIALPPLVLMLAGPTSTGGRPAFAKALAVLAAATALPLIALLAWAAAENDLAQFWYQNFTVNTRLTGTVIASQAALCDTWTSAFAWPMISIPLAIFGLAHLITLDTSAARFRSLTCVLLLIASIALVLAGAGPFRQYHYAFFVILAGLGGAAAEPLLRSLPRGGRLIGLVLLMAATVCWWYLMVNLRMRTATLDLRASLQPLQAVLDQSRPDDTFVSLQHCNPVFMKDADPGQFMKVVCFADDPQTIQEVYRTIFERRPAFVVGAGCPIWGPQAQVVTTPIDPRLGNDYEIISQQWGILKRTRR